MRQHGTIRRLNPNDRYSRFVVRQLTIVDILDAVLEWPSIYATRDGRRFKGMRVSEISKFLIQIGWRNVSHIDRMDIEAMGGAVVEATYVQGARPTGQWIWVVVHSWYDKEKSNVAP
jgi:thermostable 8-oxoguanine DNA glycosylase